MSHAGIPPAQAEIFKVQLGSYVKPVSSERIKQIRNETGAGLLECKRKEEKERMLAAIEEIRWESGTEYNSAMHTVLDVLQYLVERT